MAHRRRRERGTGAPYVHATVPTVLQTKKFRFLGTDSEGREYYSLDGVQRYHDAAIAARPAVLMAVLWPHGNIMPSYEADEQVAVVHEDAQCGMYIKVETVDRKRRSRVGIISALVGNLFLRETEGTEDESKQPSKEPETVS